MRKLFQKGLSSPTGLIAPAAPRDILFGENPAIQIFSFRIRLALGLTRGFRRSYHRITIDPSEITPGRRRDETRSA
jgi:hypothetical protein